jgi:hypothetical protein
MRPPSPVSTPASTANLNAELDVLEATAKAAMVRAGDELRSEIRRLEEIESQIRIASPWASLPWLYDLRDRLARLHRWAESGRRFIQYDPSGDGLVTEVLGSLSGATNIAVIVPGVTSSEHNFERYVLRDARRLFTKAPDTAVVAWLGYDAPGGGRLGTSIIDWSALDADRALSGVSELVDLVAWLRLHRSDAHISVVAHSYGSVLAGAAASEGLSADELVLLGSPGVPVARAAALHLRPEAGVWAGLAAWDPIDELAALAALGGHDDESGHPSKLVHGANPMHESFGATLLDLGQASGHDGYFGPHGLAAILPIVAPTPSDARRPRKRAMPPRRKHDPD